MLTQIAFLRIAVPDLEQGLSFYRDALGMPELARGRCYQFKGQTAVLGLGESRIVLVEPDGADSPAARFLAERRGGVLSVGLGSDSFSIDTAHFTARDLAAGAEPVVEEGLGPVLALPGNWAAGLPLEVTPRVSEAMSGSLLKRLDHVAAVVCDLDGAVAQFRSQFELQPDPAQSYLEFPDLQTRNAMIRFGHNWLELNQCFSDQSIFGQHFAQFGASVLGVALEPCELAAALARLEKAGVGCSPPAPVTASRTGAAPQAIAMAAVPSMKASLGCRIFLVKPDYH